ncbi:spore germination protein [Paenibacillus protaetiae]|nr:spore germination protein [Paenibacillus protaetiae]
MANDKIVWSEQLIRETYKESSDVIIETCRYGTNGEDAVVLFYANGLCDSNEIRKVVQPELALHFEQNAGDKLSFNSLVTMLTLAPFEENSMGAVDQFLFAGDLILFFVKEKALYHMSINKRPQRSPSESATEISIRGPKDGFIEDAVTNVAIIRKRMRTNSLHVKAFTIGTRTQTTLSLLYLADVINPKILDEVTKKLNSIDRDGIYTIDQLDEVLTGSKIKILPLLEYTGRPDFAVNALLSGRFIIVLDGNPMVVIGPAGLTLILKSPEDIHFNYSYVTFARLIRGISLFFAIFLPGIWVALMAFHQDQIPFRIMATVAISRLGLPFSSQIEMFILLMLLEIFREAGIRLPNAIGQTLTSIGGLIIGDAAIRAGLVSPSVVVIGAITAVSGVTLVNQSLSSVVSIMRLFFFILGCYLGLYGVILGIVLFISYLASQKSFGVSYLAPLSPFRFKDAIASFMRLPWFMMKKRPSGMMPQDKDRLRS